MLFSSIAAIYRVIYTPSIIIDATRDTPDYRTNLKRQVVHNNFFTVEMLAKSSSHVVCTDFTAAEAAFHR